LVTTELTTLAEFAGISSVPGKVTRRIGGIIIAIYF
jgi:hypothetical protein